MTRTGNVSGCKRLFFAVTVSAAMMCLMMSEPYAEEQVYAGRVVFEGQPVEGAEVYLGREQRRDGVDFYFETERIAQTGPDGLFSVSHITEKSESSGRGIIATCPGYSTEDLLLNQWVDPQSIEIQIHNASTVSGVVRTQDGKPVSDALVYLNGYDFDRPSDPSRLSSDLPGMTARTDEEGRYRLYNVPEGARISIAVTKQGFSSVRTTAEAGASAPDILLDPAGVIAGRVTVAETGEPVIGVVVSAAPYAGVSSVTTDEDGQYVFDGVNAGTYRIIVQSDAQHLGFCARPTERLVVNQGETRENIDIEMVQGVIVNGTVTDKDTGEPIEGCSVLVTPNQTPSNIYGYAVTDNEGHFQTTALPGNIYFHAMPVEGYSGLYTEDTLQSHVVGDVGVEGGVHLRLTKEPVITGTVYLPDGSPAKGAVVGETLTDITDTSGHFTLELRQHNPAYPLKVNMSELGLEGEAFVNTALNELVEIHLHPYRYASVSGVILDTSGNPVEGIPVERYWKTGMIGLENAAAAISDSDGSFTVDSLRIGRHYILGVRSLQARTEVIEAGVDTGPYTLVLPVADRWLEGRVVDEDGEPVSGYTIYIFSETSGNQKGTTDENGLFRIEHLVSETERISVGLKYYRDIPTNTFQELTLYNNRDRTIGGNIIDTDGNPVKNATLTFENPYGLYNVERAADQTGRFLLKDMIGKTLTVTVTCDGYEPLTMECKTDTDDNTFVLTPVSGDQQ